MRPVLVFLSALVAAPASATPATFQTQGRVLDATGTPLTATTALTFTLYDQPTGGTVLWSETHTVSLQDGYYAVELGTVVPLDATVLDGTARYLGVQPAGQPELAPRTPVLSVPYAIRSGGFSLSAAAPFTCDAAHTGAAYFDTTESALRVCDGAVWANPDGTRTGRTCKEILARNPGAPDGVYTLDVDGPGPATPFETWCDMANGGWTLLARTVHTGLTAAERDAIRRGTWDAYTRDGYGSPVASSRIFWLPLERWNQFTTAYPSNVWRSTDSSGEIRVADFSIGDASTNFRIAYGATVNGYLPLLNGTTNLQNQAFTTWDRDNDTWPSNCAKDNVGFNGGFWYTNCWQNSMLHADGGLYSWRQNGGFGQNGWSVTRLEHWIREN